MFDLDLTIAVDSYVEVLTCLDSLSGTLLCLSVFGAVCCHMDDLVLGCLAGGLSLTGPWALFTFVFGFDSYISALVAAWSGNMICL